MADKKLEDVLKEIEKIHGNNSVLLLGDDYVIPKIDVISTNSIKINNALGVGGIPRGRIVEIYGPESSGKTTFCLHVIAEAQKLTKDNERFCAIIDTEHALDLSYAKKLGVDVDNLVMSQPDYGEQALGICEELIKSEKFSLVIVDSVAALTPRAELEGDMGDSVMGLQARLMSQAMRKLTALVSKTNTTLIFTNQLRDKIGVMFGSPETTTGGKALKFYASIRIDIRKKTAIKSGENIIGNQVKLKIVKNKVAPPYKEAEVEILYNEGISQFNEVIDLATEYNIIKKAGAWFSYEEVKVQGKDQLKDVLKNNSEMFETIKTAVIEASKSQ